MSTIVVPIKITLPKPKLDWIKGPWLAKLTALTKQRDWTPAGLNKTFLRWDTRNATTFTYLVREPGVYQGLCGNPDFDPNNYDPDFPVKKQATRSGLFYVWMEKATGKLHHRKLKGWNEAWEIMLPESKTATQGCEHDYVTMIGDQLAFDFKKYERVPQERSSTNDSRYNRVNCSECKGEGFDLRFGKKGQCPCCGGKGYYLTDINTKDPIEFLTSYHRWTKSQELRRQADEQLAQNLDSGTQTFWMEYDPVTPRKRIIEHFPRTDDALNLPEGSIVAAESWNIDIETLQKNFARQDDLAQEVA